ncbi:MAG: hypothetical protein ACTHNU_12050 [Gaiellales bacterium]
MGKLTGIFGEGWRLHRRQWAGPTLVGLVVSLAVAGLSAAATSQGSLGGLATVLVAGLAGCLIVQAALAHGVSDARAGANAPLGGSLAAAGRRAGSVIGVAFAVAAVVTLGLFAFLLPGLLLLTWWGMAIPSVVLDGAAGAAALSRSRRLVTGHASDVFAMVVISIVLALAVSVALSVVFLGLSPVPRVIAASTAEGALLVPYLSVVWTIAYLRLRDLEPMAEPA